MAITKEQFEKLLNNGVWREWFELQDTDLDYIRQSVETDIDFHAETN